MRSSICFITCVAGHEEYARCRQSIDRLRPGGLEVMVEPIDNAGNRLSCPQALNLGWARASADLLVFCHDDVVFPAGWLEDLLAGIRAVESREGEAWGVLGPVGRAGKRYFGHVTGPGGAESFHGPLPSRVDTLDELCLVVRRSLPLRFDEALGGYHLYGVDLCIQAREAGLVVAAIDAPCLHDSLTLHRPPAYHEVKRRLQRKWMFRRRRVGRSVGTTCGRIRFGIFEGWI